MRAWVARWMIGLVLLAALPPVSFTVHARAANAVRRFEATKCPFRLPVGQVEGKTVDCGFVVVPEEHEKQDDPTIRLAVARFHSTASAPAPDAAIYLQGGPGGATLSTGIVRSFTTLLTPTRDFIAFDQRGTGYSEPNLDCPEVRERSLQDDTRGVSASDEAQDEIAAALICQDRLIGQGINLAAYDSTQSAADVNDIRAALGYEKLDLIGISYGTRLGLTVLRDFPGIVRSAVLDSVSPLQVNSYEEYAVSLDRAINLLFANCAADTRCNTAFPSLHDNFTQVYTQLAANPVTVTVTGSNTSQKHDLVIDGTRFVGLVHVLLYFPSGIARIPVLIAQIEGGDQKLLRTVVEATYFDRISIGMGLSVRCNEYVPFNDRDRAFATIETLLPEIQELSRVDVQKTFDLCAQWHTKTSSPPDHLPVMSDVPTLVMESANDPVTPPKFGQTAARTLSHGFYVEAPGIGHSVLGNGHSCGTNIMLSFLGDPTTQPDTSCTTSLGVTYVTTY